MRRPLQSAEECGTRTHPSASGAAVLSSLFSLVCSLFSRSLSLSLRALSAAVTVLLCARSPANSRTHCAAAGCRHCLSLLSAAVSALRPSHGGGPATWRNPRPGVTTAGARRGCGRRRGAPAAAWLALLVWCAVAPALLLASQDNVPPAEEEHLLRPLTNQLTQELPRLRAGGWSP